MKRTRIFFLLIAGVLSIAASGYADTVETQLAAFLSDTEKAALMREGQLFRASTGKNDAVPMWTPPFGISEKSAENRLKGRPSYLLEALYLHKKKNGSQPDAKKISQILRSISKLEGLRYYSSSRKKMRTLYETSYVIDDPQSKRRQADPLDHPADNFSVYALQKDLTFGAHVYQYRFFSDADSAGFVSTNTDTLKYSVFKAVLPECLQVSVAVTDLGDYLLIHAITRADFSAPSFLRKRIRNSLKTRGEAVYGWFIAHYDEE